MKGILQLLETAFHAIQAVSLVLEHQPIAQVAPVISNFHHQSIENNLINISEYLLQVETVFSNVIQHASLALGLQLNAQAAQVIGIFYWKQQFLA